MFKKRVHVYPIDGGRWWGVGTFRGYECIWYSLVNHGWRVALYNLGVLLGVVQPERQE